MSAAVQQRLPGRMTTAEFMDWPGDEDGTKYQLVDGEVMAMAPPSEAHGRIHGQMTFMLAAHLERARPECHVVTGAGVVPRVHREFNVRIPDLLVTCAQHQPGQQLIQDPVLIAEILSISHEREKRSNVWAFVSIPSVREILLVKSYEMGAELLRRQPDATWPIRPEILGADSTLRLESIDGTSCLRDLYKGVTFALTAE